MVDNKAGARRQADQAGRASHGAAKASPPSGDHPSRYRLERYDRNSARIICAGGWVVAMIERLSNDRWVICVGDQRYGIRTFASPRAAITWWKGRQTAIAMEARSVEAAGLHPKDDSAGRNGIAQPAS